MSSRPDGPLIPMADLLGFPVLRVLAMAVRRPSPRWLAVVFLLAYSGGTELLQGCVTRTHPNGWVCLGIRLGLRLVRPHGRCWKTLRLG